MPTITDNFLTLADVAQRSRDKAARTIIEIMAQTNDIITDAPAVVCNNGTVHKTVLRDELPTPTIRAYNQGVPAKKTATRERMDHTCLLANWTKLDADMADLKGDNGTIKQQLADEARAVLAGMAIEGATLTFYGDRSLDPNAFDGFTPRYNALPDDPDNPTVPETRNVVDAGGTGAKLTSAWLINWDSLSNHLIYPDGTTAGIKQEVLPKSAAADSAGDEFPAIKVYYRWYLGLACRDWRKAVRVANIDVAALQNIVAGGAPTAADTKLLRIFQHAANLLPSGITGKTCWYTNRQVGEMLDIIAGEKANVQLNYNMPVGPGQPQQIKTFMGYTMRRCDALMIGEPAVA